MKLDLSPQELLWLYGLLKRDKENCQKQLNQHHINHANIKETISLDNSIISKIQVLCPNLKEL